MSLSVIIPVVTETNSLRQTVDIVMSTSREEVGQIILVASPQTTSESLSVCRQIKDELGHLVLIHQQELPYLGNALREAFALATESHVVMMASDLETDPWLMPELIQSAKDNPSAVVTASRWLKHGSFFEYGAVRVGLNRLFQALGRALYQTSLSDLTFGYRLFPTALVQGIHWEGERHNFLLETILKPIRLGVPVIEVPTSWHPRTDGRSQNSLMIQAEYITMLLRCRLIKRRSIVEPTPRTLARRESVAI